MSHSHDPHGAGASAGYGAGGRTARPLFALIPIGIALVVCLAMLAEGLHIMTTPADTGAGHVTQTAAPPAG